MYKLNQDLKKRMEREIRQYDNNKNKIEKMKSQLSTRQLLYLEERLQHVKTAYERLKPNEQEVYDLIFKKGCNWLYCQTMYSIDKTTYYNVYNKSLYLLAQEWGEV